MVDRKAPDYELDDTLELGDAEQFRALFDDTRLRVVDLLLERAATISELAETLGRPKGTIGYHVAVLEEAGLIRVVRTEPVRALTAKYYGRTARTYLLNAKPDLDVELTPDFFLTSAAAEYAQAAEHGREPQVMVSTLRYARIPDEKADEWIGRLTELAQEFTSEARGGDTTYGLLVALYPTDRPHLPDRGEEA